MIVGFRQNAKKKDQNIIQNFRTFTGNMEDSMIQNVTK